MSSDIVSPEWALIAMRSACERTSTWHNVVRHCIARMGIGCHAQHRDEKSRKKRKMKYSSEIIVVGAGAAGMVAAITAARAGASVLILEHMDTAGKKILATGNGKCNYTNSRQGVEYYYGDDPAFVLPVFAQFGFEDTLKFFGELGILPKEKRGYYYPASEQAASIREVLLMELNRLNVKIQYHCGIRGIYREQKGFRFDTKEGDYTSRICLLATGGCASKKTGSDGSGFCI